MNSPQSVIRPVSRAILESPLRVNLRLRRRGGYQPPAQENAAESTKKSLHFPDLYATIRFAPCNYGPPTTIMAAFDEEIMTMKQGIHPNYKQTTIRCACGNVIETGSTKQNITVEICSKCHPFFTGKQKLVDTSGRVDKFNKKYGIK